MTEKTTSQRGKEQDGFVVWDQQGLVVVWPDEHRSRFSWEALRRVVFAPSVESNLQGTRLFPNISPDLLANQ